MPSKNVIKSYVENGVYHIYNRGVDKRTIFLEDLDYRVFLNELKTALSYPPNSMSQKKSFTLKGSTFKGIPRLPLNLHKKIELLAYCLIPNHFHLLIKQRTKEAMSRLMRSISTRYSMYFNKKYERKGNLFQSIYRALLITNDAHFLHLSRYIHRNPREFWTKPLQDYPYSSYAEYLGLRKTIWIFPMQILSFFKSQRKTGAKDLLSYQSFVEYNEDKNKDMLTGLTLDE